MTNGAVFVSWTLFCDKFFFSFPSPKPWNIRNYISPSVSSHNPPYITLTTIPLTPAALNKEKRAKKVWIIHKQTRDDAAESFGGKRLTRLIPQSYLFGDVLKEMLSWRVKNQRVVFSTSAPSTSSSSSLLHLCPDALGADQV